MRLVRVINVIFLLVFFLASCTKLDKEKYSTEIIVPLLSECEGEIEKTLMKLNVNYEIIKADIILDSHPSITGFVKIQSDSKTKETLGYSANNFIFKCYPIATISVNKNNTSNLNSILEERKRAGLDPSYIVNREKTIEIYSKNYSASEDVRFVDKLN